MDEMDLARQALDVTPWRPEEYERARAVLRGAMDRVRDPDRGRLRCGEAGLSRARSRGRGTLGARGKVGIGAGIAAVAAAAAVVLASTSAPPPAKPAASAGSAGARGDLQAGDPGRPHQGR